ncbi:MAG: hypothetical protein WBE38_04465, partial [Terracidiphilus sp.]
MPGRKLSILSIVPLLFLWPAAAVCSTTNLTCKKLSDYRIVTPQILLIECGEPFAASEKPLEV